MKQNNRGFTLVELMVVIAVMAVLAGMATLSLSTVFSTAARQSANEASALISKCRIGCMSRAEAVYLEFYIDDRGRAHGVYHEGTAEEDETLSSREVSVGYALETNSGDVEGAAHLFVSFDRATGRLCDFGTALDGTVRSTENAVLTFSAGGSAYTVTIDALTGTHTLKG